MFAKKRIAAAQQRQTPAASGLKNMPQSAAPKPAQAARVMGQAERMAAARMEAARGMNRGMKKGGDVKKMAKGGGCEIKGKTKGTMVKMAKGGKSC
jgi:hypothetical protein